MVQITYELRARQQTSLTPRLQQSVKLLQMSTLDFSREVVQAIATNPFLEEHEEPGEADAPEIELASMLAGQAFSNPGQPSQLEDAYVHENNEPFPDNAQDKTDPASRDEPDTQYCEADRSELDQSYSGDYPSGRDPNRPDTDVGQWAHSEANLRDTLRENMCNYGLSERDRLLVEFIIEALDEDGYLRVPFAELSQAGQLSPPADETEWEVALRLVQQAAMPGLAARDLAECLALQLAALAPETPGKRLAIQVVEQGLEKLAKCEYAGLARLYGCTEDDVREASALIRTLDPRPADRYVSVDPTCYVVPDVVVRKIGKLWVPLPNHEAVPRARLHNSYAQLFRESRYNERSLMAKALQEARWLIRSLEQRNTTIHRVAQAIVARQQTFFDYGEIALRPLMLSEIADELGMHESTVSRATSNKYLASPRGVYEFKHFFSRELATRSGGTCSAGAVRALIQEMIVAENPQDPLSDVALAQKLASEGVVVARRTVSKYRAQIKYPAAELRRTP